MCSTDVSFALLEVFLSLYLIYSIFAVCISAVFFIFDGTFITNIMCKKLWKNAKFAGKVLLILISILTIIPDIIGIIGGILVQIFRKILSYLFNKSFRLRDII